MYIQTNKTKTLKLGNYNSIKYTYVSTTTTHKTLGRVKIVFIKTKDNLIPIISTNTNLSDIDIEDDLELDERTHRVLDKVFNLRIS